MDLMTTAQLLGNFGEFFGAIAVVATLAYLAAQIRQNTRSVGIETERYVNDAWNRILADLATDERIAEVIVRGLEDYVSLPKAEKAIFHSRVGQVLDHSYTQRRMLPAGSDPAFVEQMDEIAAMFINSPGGKQWWNDVGHAFVHYEHVQDYMAREGKDVPPITALSPWQWGNG